MAKWIPLLLILTACQPITSSDIEDAERMCERQDGVSWMKKGNAWLTVECNNGMVFKQAL